MPFRRQTLPSFTFTTTSSSRNSFTLPDYYRSTRLEQYGPYYRSSEPVQDLMVNFKTHILAIVVHRFILQKTIDLRGRDSPNSICALVRIISCYFLELCFFNDKRCSRISSKMMSLSWTWSSELERSWNTQMISPSTTALNT